MVFLIVKTLLDQGGGAMLLQRDVIKYVNILKTMPSFSKQEKNVSCPLCAKNGILSYLKLVQINFEEALNKCLTKGCIFPLNHNFEKYLVRRSSAEFFTKQPDENSPQIVENESTEAPEPTDFDLVYDMLNEKNEDCTTEEINKANDIINEILFQDNDEDVLKINVPEQTGNPCSNLPKTNTNVESVEEDVIIEELQADDNTNNEINSKEINKNLSDSNLPNRDAEINYENIFTTKYATAKESENKHQNDSFDSEHQNLINNELQQTPLQVDDLYQTGPLGLPSRKDQLLQWSNKDNSCWLDVILLFIVNSINVRSCLNVWTEADLFGEICSIYDLCQGTFSSSNYSNENIKLSKVREKLFRLMQTKIHLKRGEFESPVELLPTIFKLSKPLEKSCIAKVRREFECSKCGFKTARRSSIPVVSLPNTKPDFHPLKAEFSQECYKCKSINQAVSLHLEKLPPLLLMHFQTGVPHSKLKIWDFVVSKVIFSVYAVIQYRLKPYKHFILWMRDAENDKWIKFDDLVSEICEWDFPTPNIPSNEIHFIMWERQGITDPTTATEKDLDLIENIETCRDGDAIPQYVYNDSILDDNIDISVDLPKPDENMDRLPTFNNTSMTHSVGQENVNSEFPSLLNNFEYEIENSVLPDLIAPDSNQNHSINIGSRITQLDGLFHNQTYNPQEQKIIKKKTVDFINLGKRNKILKHNLSNTLDSYKSKKKRINVKKLQPYKLSKNR